MGGLRVRPSRNRQRSPTARQTPARLCSLPVQAGATDSSKVRAVRLRFGPKNNESRPLQAAIAAHVIEFATRDDAETNTLGPSRRRAQAIQGRSRF